jgi:hypothetical protein
VQLEVQEVEEILVKIVAEVRRCRGARNKV